VTLVAVLDADKEGFLRSETSLIQVSGRAARNVAGTVVLYADQVTDSMKRAVAEMARRREIQRAWNVAHGVTPRTVVRRVKETVATVYAERDYVDLTDLPDDVPGDADAAALARKRDALETAIRAAARDLRFEDAARLRDERRRIDALIVKAGERAGGPADA
jgi:excinuclease ABC subunit B